MFSTSGIRPGSGTGELNQVLSFQQAKKPCHSERAKPARNLLFDSDQELKRATVWPSASFCDEPSAHSGAGRSGRQKIEKRSYVWRFLALKVPFRNPKSLNRCPVAGTD